MDSSFLYNSIDQKYNSLLYDNVFKKLQVKIDNIDAYPNNITFRPRLYQNNALLAGSYAIKYTNNKHLLFDMATGSGKTNVMAALILYLFNYYHIHNFLYTISKTAVLNQTKKSFSTNGSRALFTNHLKDTNGNPIKIQFCNSFPTHPLPNTINICCISIQALNHRVFNPIENDFILDSATQNPLVILADEAHHYNADTLKGKNKKKSFQENHSWEHTLKTIRKRCKNNNKTCYQLDFTATVDLTNPIIKQKYEPIMVYRYTIRDFWNDGYSKNINIVHTNDDTKNKMLLAVLINQFRILFARLKLQTRDSKPVHFKPVLMFKSSTKNKSKRNETKFKQLIRNLTFSDVNSFVSRELSILNKNKKNPLLTNLFNWWSNYLIQIKSSPSERQAFLQELIDDFTNNDNIINLNSKDDLKKNKWNNIDDIDRVNNPIRVIFEVQKVDEGWDVHSLFDVVRLSNSNFSYTLRESQLIGRAARYYYFDTSDRSTQPESKYKRCYRGATTKYKYNKILETLTYITIDNPTYNKKLYRSLRAMHTPYNTDNSDYPLPAKVTKTFKSSDVFKHGFIYTNLPKYRKKIDYKSLLDFNIRPEDRLFNVYLNYDIKSINVQQYNNTFDDKRIIWKDNKSYSFNNYKKFTYDLMPSIPFYRFNRMNKCLPITSIKEFINDYLNGYTIKIHDTRKINYKDIVSAFKQVLTSIGNKLEDNFKKPVGTTKFVPVPVKSIISNYQRNVPINSNHKMNKQTILPKPMNIKKKDIEKFRNTVNTLGYPEYKAHEKDEDLAKSHTWFTFNYEIGNRLERDFVSDISTIISKIKERWHPKFVFLLRNDEANGKFSLHDIPRKHNEYPKLDLYMPDFILYISHPNNAYAMYELYLEPKGNKPIYHNLTLSEKDAWKQNLLEFIKPTNVTIDNSELVASNKINKKYLGSINDVNLYGIKFYEYSNSTKNTTPTNWLDVRKEIFNKLKLQH